MKKGSRLACLLLVPGALLFFAPFCLAGSIMVDKNLFAEDRKPPSPDAAPPAPAGPSAPGLQVKSVQLDGIFIHGDVKSALIRLKGPLPGGNKGKVQSPFKTVHEGEQLGDYQVVKIESRSVSLSKDGQTFVVDLFADGKVSPPAMSVPMNPAAMPNAPGQQPPTPAMAPPPEMMPGGARGDQQVIRPHHPPATLQGFNLGTVVPQAPDDQSINNDPNNAPDEQGQEEDQPQDEGEDSNS